MRNIHSTPEINLAIELINVNINMVSNVKLRTNILASRLVYTALSILTWIIIHGITVYKTRIVNRGTSLRVRTRTRDSKPVYLILIVINALVHFRVPVLTHRLRLLPLIRPLLSLPLPFPLLLRLLELLPNIKVKNRTGR